MALYCHLIPIATYVHSCVKEDLSTPALQAYCAVCRVTVHFLHGHRDRLWHCDCCIL